MAIDTIGFNDNKILSGTDVAYDSNLTIVQKIKELEKAIADQKIDITIEDGRFVIGKFQLLYGVAIVTPKANTPTSLWVTFSHPFSVAPKVVASGDTTVMGTTVKAVGANGPTTTGFNAIVTRSNTTATYVDWIAVGLIE